MMIRSKRFATLLVLAMTVSVSPVTRAEPIPPATQKVVEGYKAKLTGWAANPVVIAATKASNAHGGLPGMTPAKWTELSDADPAVKSVMTSPAGKWVDTLDSDEVNKVVVRDKAGNVVAANTKVVLYNVAHRPVFKNAIGGQPWQQDAVQKDTTTQLLGVQISVPIKDGAEVIGVMHASITSK